MENTNVNQPRVINISKMQVASFLGLGWSRENIATFYGVTPQDMYKAMRELGFYKQKETNSPKVDYVINLTFDEPIINSGNSMDIVVGEQPEIIVDNYQEGSDEANVDPSENMEISESVGDGLPY
jgi:hypothetical protein